MTQVTVRIEGADRLRAGLNRWLTTIQTVTHEIIRAAMERAMHESVPYQGGNSYAVPERGYVRTGNLGSNTLLIQEGLSYRIESHAYNRSGEPYSPHVIGRADGSGQAGVHVGYWTPLREAVDQELDTLTEDLNQAFQDSAEAIGL